MKLNPDCIRDLLLDIEAKSTFDNVVFYSEEKDEPLFDKYGVDTIFLSYSSSRLRRIFYRRCILHV